jgi:hypothetical protein
MLYSGFLAWPSAAMRLARSGHLAVMFGSVTP